MAKQALEVTIDDVIKWVLPEGSSSDGTWQSVCPWPPDLFAVVASIVDVSGLYSDAAFVAYWHEDFCLNETWIGEVREIGRKWRTEGVPPIPVQDLWSELVTRHANACVVDDKAPALEWKKIVFRLLSITDEAAVGIGFAPAAGSSPPKVRLAYDADYVEWERKRAVDRTAVGGRFLDYLPHSLCMRVPPEVACVQPKSSTPAVGCTLRSMTHHLALLPPIGNVTTHWLIADRAKDEGGPFNMLLVPFPYSLPGKSFSEAADHFPGEANDRTFTLDPDAWMKDVKPKQFADFLCELINATSPEMKAIHAVVLPETALRLPMADEVAKRLAAETELELFLTGAISGEGTKLRNVAAMYRFSRKQVSDCSFQSKHHRWRLEQSQIKRYQLGHVLDLQKKYWERIDVSYRNCYVTNFRPGAALSLLVCEDLARYDPVLTVMNAIGPNLVVALLMDGAQLEKRWPGRYATVLAEDPGSAVLTLTSLGMVTRACMPGETQNREIGLWKEPDGMARELKLPRGDHALVLSLATRRAKQVTLDGRGDGTQTVNFVLGAAHSVRLPKLPQWLEPPS